MRFLRKTRPEQRFDCEDIVKNINHNLIFELQLFNNISTAENIQ